MKSGALRAGVRRTQRAKFAYIVAALREDAASRMRRYAKTPLRENVPEQSIHGYRSRVAENQKAGRSTARFQHISA